MIGMAIGSSHILPAPTSLPLSLSLTAPSKPPTDSPCPTLPCPAPPPICSAEQRPALVAWRMANGRLQTVKRNSEMLFVRGDGVILVSIPRDIAAAVIDSGAWTARMACLVLTPLPSPLSLIAPALCSLSCAAPHLRSLARSSPKGLAAIPDMSAHSLTGYEPPRISCISSNGARSKQAEARRAASGRTCDHVISGGWVCIPTISLQGSCSSSFPSPAPFPRPPCMHAAMQHLRHSSTACMHGEEYQLLVGGSSAAATTRPSSWSML